MEVSIDEHEGRTRAKARCVGAIKSRWASVWPTSIQRTATSLTSATTTWRMRAPWPTWLKTIDGRDGATTSNHRHRPTGDISALKQPHNHRTGAQTQLVREG